MAALYKKKQNDCLVIGSIRHLARVQIEAVTCSSVMREGGETNGEADMRKVTMKIIILAAFAGGMMTSGASFAQSACQNLDGEWAGTMSGRFAGPISMSISNCKVTWKLPDGRTNYCSYSEKNGKLEYACSLGSQGTVTAQARRITMRNTYTGNDYVASFTKK